MKPWSHEIAVIGAGSFGTTLASVLAAAGKRTLLWARRADQALEINQNHTNAAYLDALPLPAALRATSDLEEAARAAEVVLVVVPSKAFRSVVATLGDYIGGDQVLIHATKGLEKGSYKRMSEILLEETCALKIGALSGPNLAREIVSGQPAGALIASHYETVVEEVIELFAGSNMRVYGGHDLIGTEIAGAFKNIVALAAGAVDGLGLGDNTKSLLITRGLSEMARYGVALGGKVFTFGGLAGIGDLMATCSSALSRNYRLGRGLAQGKTMAEMLTELGQVAEGVPTTMAVYASAQSRGLQLNIVRAVHGVLFEEWIPSHALEYLMSNPVGHELAQLSF